jgi:hypothetical protein
MKCADCKFWRPGEDQMSWGEGVGECRRYAPRPEVDHRDDVSKPIRDFTIWPLTLDDQFCGEFVTALDDPVSP